MNLTIIPIDGAVYVDGYSFSGLDLTAAPADVHALQWGNDKGWIEFKDSGVGAKPQNQDITELPDWANACKAKWDEAKAAEAAAILAAQQAAEEAAILAAQQAAEEAAILAAQQTEQE
jgi:hypothetical protein